ncbi:MAG TPA: DUF4142 domain-containing protein [Candidatus Aquilonibacter sp.]|nr:DUF4142 domain-containing protein [Candidatus Aquilonibacter sp.]
MRHRHRAQIALFSCLMLACGAVASAQSKHASLGDDQFVRQALVSGTQEIRQGGKDADSTNAAIDAFAMRMVKDHSYANTQLLALAHQLDITVPNGMLPASGAQEEAKGVQSPPVSNNQPNPKAYFAAQVADHKKAVALFEHEIAHGRNPQIVAFARKTLPVLRSHLQFAEKELAHPAH